MGKGAPGPDHTHPNVSQSHTWDRIHTGSSYTGSSWAHSPRDFYLSSLQTETVTSLLPYPSNNGVGQNNIKQDLSIFFNFQNTFSITYAWSTLECLTLNVNFQVRFCILCNRNHNYRASAKMQFIINTARVISTILSVFLSQGIYVKCTERTRLCNRSVCLCV